MQSAYAFGTLYIKRKLLFRRRRSQANEIAIRGTLNTGRRTGRSLPEIPAQAGVAGRGKSELRRAVCRITSGTRASRPVDGKCHREHTAIAWSRLLERHPGISRDLVQKSAPCNGKGEKVR